MKNTKLTNDELEHLAREAINGRGRAFEMIYEAKRRELYLTALRLLESPEDAEDAVQETLMNVFQRIHRLRYPRALNSWLYKILYQKCTDIIRKRQLRRKVDTALTDDDVADWFPDDDGDYIPEKRAEKDEMGEVLRSAILSLPEKSREAFILYYLNDMKYSEIAEATGTSVKTVSTNLMRARRKLRSHLEVAGAGFKSAFAAKLAMGAQGVAVKVGIGAVGALCAAGVTWYALAEEPLPEPEPANFFIALSSNDCECGHINPKDIGLRGIRSGDVVSTWEVADASGNVVFSGSLADTTAYITGLETSGPNGAYVLRCAVTDKHGYEYGVSREIAIGAYKGDVR
ncbi:MAG: RNA polymerase sigma factor [Clostridiales Family XIII bacterium]|jgi:RNA polymerase sigma-70 factor (ECF subfamily)|nr:RNA polymerase sigma factor [Clostridiales Family XIII bacterium]